MFIWSRLLTFSLSAPCGIPILPPSSLLLAYPQRDFWVTAHDLLISSPLSWHGVSDEMFGRQYFESPFVFPFPRLQWVRGSCVSGRHWNGSTDAVMCLSLPPHHFWSTGLHSVKGKGLVSAYQYRPFVSGKKGWCGLFLSLNTLQLAVAHQYCL